MMGRKSKLVIEESVEELKALQKKQSKRKNSDRIGLLLYVKQNTFRTRQELSVHMGISRRSIERWLSEYSEGGLQEMLLPEKRIRKSLLIPEDIHKALEERVMDCEQGFSSYVEAQTWLESEYGLSLKYNTIREHLIRHFKTKIKTPRKSHVKKDIEAAKTFLKTT